MAEPREGPDSLEGMAFQLVLHKLGSLERAIQAMPPLLKKIVDHLEAQTKQPEVEVATYAQLYPEWPQDEGKEQAGATQERPTTVETDRPHVRRRVWHWFLKKG
jgi:hypothetical protein